jgi:hypothetical protein
MASARPGRSSRSPAPGPNSSGFQLILIKEREAERSWKWRGAVGREGDGRAASGVGRHGARARLAVVVALLETRYLDQRKTLVFAGWGGSWSRVTAVVQYVVGEARDWCTACDARSSSSLIRCTPSVPKYKVMKSSNSRNNSRRNGLYTPHFTLPTNSPLTHQPHSILSYPSRTLYFGTKFEPSRSLYTGTEGVTCKLQLPCEKFSKKNCPVST